MQGEYKDAVRLANRVLDNPHLDPDGDLCVLARQLIRTSEAAESALQDQVKYCSNSIHVSAQTLLDQIKAARE